MPHFNPLFHDELPRIKLTPHQFEGFRCKKGEIKLKGIKTAFLILLASMLLSAQGCTTYKIFKPRPIEESNFKQHAQTKQNDDLRISVSILSARESYAALGLPLKLAGIQVIWVAVENSDDHPYWLLYPALDPDHFSPDEVAYAFRAAMSDEDLKEAMQRLRRLAFKNPVRPGEKKSGFVFVNLDEDSKQVEIELLGVPVKHFHKKNTDT